MPYMKHEYSLTFGELAALTVALEYDIKHPDNISSFDIYEKMFEEERKKNEYEPQ
jgi:hypothetical protein